MIIQDLLVITETDPIQIWKKKNLILVYYLVMIVYFISKLDDEKLLIDNQPFNLSQINTIAYKVLNKCNIAKSKNKNNNGMLKAGEGKLMMTNGISISEFIKKYKL